MSDTNTESVAPETPPAAGVADAPSVETAPAPEVPAVPEPEPQARPKDPLISVVTGLRAKTRTLEQQLADAQAMVTRLSQQPANPDAPAATPAAPAPRPDDTEVDRRADYKLFVRDVQTMQQHGVKEFGPAFNDTIRALEAYGATDDGFVSQVLAVDRANAHKLLKAIADDPEKAVSLVGMDPTQRIAELTRISMAATAPAPAPTPPAPKPAAKTAVSRAPAPPPPVEPTSHREVDWRSDQASDAEFDKGFQEMMKRRTARR